MEKRTFVELGGPVQNLKLLSDLKAEEEQKWKKINDQSSISNNHLSINNQ